MRDFPPRRVCLSISATDSHQTSDFCECFPTAYLQRRYRSGVQNFSDVPGKPIEPTARVHGEVRGLLHRLDGKVPRRVDHDPSLAADPGDDGGTILVVMAAPGLALLAAPSWRAAQ